MFIGEETTKENYHRTQTSKAWYLKIVMMEILYIFVVIWYNVFVFPLSDL
jgi:hypothetical protein